MASKTSHGDNLLGVFEIKMWIRLFCFRRRIRTLRKKQSISNEGEMGNSKFESLL